MKCYNCKKIIPDVSEVCPYCNTLVDESKNIVDFGDLDDLNLNDDKFDIKVALKEPKNRKLIIGAVCLIIIVITIFSALIASLFKGKKNYDYTLFTSVVTEFSEFLEDNFVVMKTSSSGQYRFSGNFNKENVIFTGNFGYDVKNKIISLTGNMKDPQEMTDDILIDTKDFDFLLYLKDNNIYFQSDEIYGSDYLLFPINDKTGLLTTKNYDISALVNGLSEATIEALKKMTYKTSEEKITYLGEDIYANKKTLVLDNYGKLSMTTEILKYLIDDSNFVNELARINDKTYDEVIASLQGYITTSEYKYSSESKDITTISIYYNNTKIYRIETIINDKKVIRLDVGETKYYLDIFENDKNVLSATLAVTEKELENLTEKTYDITYDTDSLVSDMSIYLEIDKQPNVKKKEITNIKEVTDLTDEDYIKIKNNTNYYLKNISFIDKIRDLYKEKCTKDLKCVCTDEEICNCTYKNEIIKCPKYLVE